MWACSVCGFGCGSGGDEREVMKGWKGNGARAEGDAYMKGALVRRQNTVGILRRRSFLRE